MLVMIVLIVMIISSALMLALLSGFLPFVQNYGNMMQYTAAYYGALSAVERGLLATRYAGPGFDGESGWTWSGGANQTINTGATSDARFNHFYTYGNGQDSLYRSVKSSASEIPRDYMGNVDPNFLFGKSEVQVLGENQNDNLLSLVLSQSQADSDPNVSNSYGFNALSYGAVEQIPLGTIEDLPASNYYLDEGKREIKFKGSDGVLVKLRLNPYLVYKFLTKSAGLTDRDNALLIQKTLPFVSWAIRGIFQNASFSLLPFRHQNIHTQAVGKFDTLVRGQNIWSDMNEYLTYLNFDSSVGEGKKNIVSPFEENLIKKSYAEILADSETSKTSNAVLSLSLLNILQTPVGAYPFLEYQVIANGGKISDRFYTIEGEGKVNNYHIKMQVKKPTLPQPALGAFTIIF